MSSTGYGSHRSQGCQEAPACVQNAMMTKDKKPFTYTPGGIDLSQIKSERMAKRLARNAQAEGAATGAAQQNRPSPGPSNSNGATSASGSMGAAALGMPFQVLPPPPPSAPKTGKQQNGFPPAPPPPPSHIDAAGKIMPSNLRSGSPNTARKSPTPQRLEPPPMGFRPEIKIPPNPMAALKKVPPPVEKNTFWKDEYVKERSKSPLPSQGDQTSVPDMSTSLPEEGSKNNSNENHGTTIFDEIDGTRKPQYDVASSSKEIQAPIQSNFQQQQSMPPVPTARPAHEQPNPKTEIRSVSMPQSPIHSIYTLRGNTPSENNDISNCRAAAKPLQIAQQHATPDMSSLPPTQQATKNQASQQAQGQAVPWRKERIQNSPMANPPISKQPEQEALSKKAVPTHPQKLQQQQKPSQLQQPAYGSFPGRNPQPLVLDSQKPTSVGSLYIAPLEANAKEENVSQRMPLKEQQSCRSSPMRQVGPSQTHQLRHQPGRWMMSQPQQREQPEWMRSEDNGTVAPSSLHRLKSPPPSQSQQQQISRNTLPVQVPMGGKANASFPEVSQQNFGSHNLVHPKSGLQIHIPNPPNQQSVSRERIIPIQLEQTPTYSPSQPNFNVASPGYIIRSPNQFVDQGYNNFPRAQMERQTGAPVLQQVVSPTQQLNAPRLVQHQQKMENNARIVPITIERGRNMDINNSTINISPNDPRSPPIQSKSFRVLQTITDTAGNGNSGNLKQEAPPQSSVPQKHQSQFSQRSNIGYSPDPSTNYIHPSEEKVFEPKKYSGSSIPSTSFKVLRAMTTPENAGPGQSDL